MKKLFYFLTMALLATLSLSVTSCSDDDVKYDPITQESIIGSWETDWVFDPDETDEPIRHVWTFNADGSFRESDEWLIDDEAVANGGWHGRWSLNEGMLNIFDGRDNEKYECYISGDILKVVPVDDPEYYITTDTYFKRR